MFRFFDGPQCPHCGSRLCGKERARAAWFASAHLRGTAARKPLMKAWEEEQRACHRREDINRVLSTTLRNVYA